MSAWINQIFNSARPVLVRATKDVAKHGGIEKLRKVAAEHGARVIKAATKYIIVRG
jgi:hypothetical protein